jgi:hypothetical protein
VVEASVTDWAPVASAGMAAIAALASWVAVSQTRRTAQQAQIPELEITVLEGLDTGEIKIHLENYGQGAARSVRFCVVEGGSAAIGALPPTGNLRAGDSRTLLTALTPSKAKDGVALVACRDAFGRTHAWGTGDKYKRWNLRMPWNRRLEQAARPWATPDC